MWPLVVCLCLDSIVASTEPRFFRQDQIIFSSDFNITSLIVPADGYSLSEDSSEIPTIFFTIADPKLEGGSCIYVLQGFAAYEILEGGRDTTSDYSTDPSIYFGARDGIYKYYPETLSAKKYGPFRDDIKQIQKANGTDLIIILTSENKLYRVRTNGTVKERVTSVPCATEFVLDTSNNLYYISCGDNLPHILQVDGSVLGVTSNIMEDFKEVKLIRPAFMMEKSIPIIADGELHILHSNGTTEKKEFALKVKPSAYSVDAAIYVIAALDGKIYEFNVMDVLIKSMFVNHDDIGDLTKVMLHVMDKPKKRVHGFQGF